MQTVLPSLGLTADVHNMCRDTLLQFFWHIWALYQALIANYRELQAQHIRLQKIASDAAQRAANAEEDAANAEEDAAYWQERAAYWQERAEQAENELDAREHRKEAKDAAKAAVLHELSSDLSRTSGSRVKFVKQQTKAVLEAQRKTAQKQAELDKLKSSIAELSESLPFDVVTQEPVMYPAIIVPSDSRMDAKIVNMGSAMNLIAQMKSKFPIGQDVTIQGVYECADVKTMYEGIFKLLKLCGHKLDE